MPTGDNQGKVRWLQTQLVKLTGKDMPLDMVHRKDRDISRDSESLREGNPHEETPFEPRSTRHTDTVDILEGESSRVKELLAQHGKVAHMLT
jgi:hypothetical protein